jgi:hypothetical protein
LRCGLSNCFSWAGLEPWSFQLHPPA